MNIKKIFNLLSNQGNKMKIDCHFSPVQMAKIGKIDQSLVGKYMSQNKCILNLVGGNVLIGYERIRGTKEQRRQWRRWAASCPEPSFRRIIGQDCS